MKRLKQIASFLLVMIYSVGIIHGAVPHSHFDHKAENTKCHHTIAQTEQCTDGLIDILIHLFSRTEFTDIADLFVGSSSMSKAALDEANLQLVAVLVPFLRITIDEAAPVATQAEFEPDFSYRNAHLSTSCRRGPPTLS